MFPYVATYLLSTINAFCYSKSKDNSARIIFLVFLFSSLFVPLALRYNIGTDYKSYVYFCEKALSGGNIYFEPGWDIIFFIISVFNLDIQFFFVIPAFLSLIIIIKTIPRKYIYLCVPVYICTLYLESFNVVRQTFAVTIFLLAIKNWLLKKHARAFIISLVSVLFHKSGIVLCFLLPLSSLEWKIFSPIRNFVLFILIVLYMKISNVAPIIMDTIISKTPYAHYVNSIFDREPELGTGLGFLLREILFLVVLAFSKSGKQNKRDGLYNLNCIAAFCMGIGHVLAIQIHIFNRLPGIFSSFYMLFCVSLLNSKSRYRKIVIYGYLSILLLLFIRTITTAYASLGGGLGLIPYQSIFSRW